MTLSNGSLDLRPSSYGQLQPYQQQNQNGGVFLQQKVDQSTLSVTYKKASNMFISKDKDDMFMWMFKFAPRKKLGMLLLCFVSIAVMLWILYVGKGEVTQEFGPIWTLGFTNNSAVGFSGYSPASVDEIKTQEFNHSLANDEMKVIINNDKMVTAQPPLAPIYFTGYALLPGNPCENFTLPPPPADKKRTGPRRPWR